MRLGSILQDVRKKVPMEIHESQHELTASSGLPLRLDLRHPADRARMVGVVVFVHGFKGFKDWGFFPYSGRWMAERGWAAVTFDFSCNGIGERPGRFDRLDLFQQNTYATELDDLARVLDWILQEAPLPRRLQEGRLGLVAHSRGHLPAAVTALEHPSVGALVSWNGVARALRYSPRQLEQWREQGKLEFVNARTHQTMAIGIDLLEDALRNAERYDLQTRLAQSSLPHLILQATGDLAVDPTEAEQLLAGRSDREISRIEWIEGTGHTWGAVHPFEGTTSALERVLELTERWLRNILEE